MSGVHGLSELLPHSQTFMILDGASGVAPGEIIPPPHPSALARMLLSHIVSTAAADQSLREGEEITTYVVPHPKRAKLAGPSDV